MIERDLDEVVRALLEEQPVAPDVAAHAALQVVREGRADLLGRILRAPPRLHAAFLEAMLAPDGADGDLARRAAVGLALGLHDPRLLERFRRHFDQRHEADTELRERLRAQHEVEERFERLLERPDAEALEAARTGSPERWLTDLIRRAVQRKTPPRVLDRLAPLGVDPGLDGWLVALRDSLDEVLEIRPAVAGWIEEEAVSRGWGGALLETLVDRATDARSPLAPFAARLLATPVWRASAQDLVLDRLAKGSWVLDGPGRQILAQLGLSARLIRALEAHAERASRIAREEAAVEMTERFRRESHQRAERLMPALHRVWAELVLVLPEIASAQRHHVLRMREALTEIMAELGVEPFGEAGERVPYRLPIHRYIGHESPPPPEAPVRVIEPGLRQLAPEGLYRIVRKALVT